MTTAPWWQPRPGQMEVGLRHGTIWGGIAAGASLVAVFVATDRQSNGLEILTWPVAGYFFGSAAGAAWGVYQHGREQGRHGSMLLTGALATGGMMASAVFPPLLIVPVGASWGASVGYNLLDRQGGVNVSYQFQQGKKIR